MTHPKRDIIIEAVEQISGCGVGASVLTERAEPWPSTAKQPILELPANFDFRAVTGWARTPEIRQQDKFCLQTVACGKLLLDRVSQLPEDIRRRGVLLGSAFGSADSECRHIEQMFEEGPGASSPCLFRNAVSNSVLGHLAIAFRFGGLSSLVMSADVSGLYAMGLARQQLIAGQCDVVITGATDFCSSIVRRRFSSHLAAGRTSAMPLMDGACLMLLRQRRAGETGYWSVAGVALGRASGADAERTLSAVRSRALGGAGLLSAEDVEVTLIHTPWGARLCNGATALREFTELLGESHLAERRSPGTSALPLMLNLCCLLHSVSRGQRPVLIGGEPYDPSFAAPAGSKRLLVVALGPGGALAVAVLVHA
jgi:hypothetical protein